MNSQTLRARPTLKRRKRRAPLVRNEHAKQIPAFQPPLTRLEACPTLLRVSAGRAPADGFLCAAIPLRTSRGVEPDQPDQTIPWPLPSWSAGGSKRNNVKAV